MGKRFSVLQRDCASYVKLPLDPEALGIAGSGINDAINSIVNIKNWSWLVTTSGFALTADDNTYPVPTDFRQERNLSLLNTAGEVARRVGFEDPKVFDTRFQHGGSSTIGTGTPDHYTVTDPYPSGVIRFDRTPNSATIDTYPSGQIMYYSRVPELVANNDTLDVPPEVESMVLWYAKSYMASIFAFDQVRYAESRWQPLFRQLKRNESENPDWHRY